MFDGHPAVLWNPPVPFTDTINSDGITLTITGHTGSGGAVTIPDSINFLPVEIIGDYAFFLCTSLTSITIPNNITSIGESAFGFCTSPTNITIPNSVTSIGDDAFGNCTSLTSITIPNSVTSIGNFVFYECYSLTNVTIPNGVTSIGDDMFWNCTSLTSITIPNGVTSIGVWAFSGTRLTSVTTPNSVTSIGYGAFYTCPSLTNVYFTGNAPTPTNDLSVFAFDNNTTAYYLPGTTGWGPTFDGLPTVLWIPQMQSFGVRMNQLGFNINWASGQTVVVEACTNPANPDWQPVQTNTLTTGSAYFSDPQWTNYPGRFYRLRSP